MPQIEGKEFTLFWEFDRDALATLPCNGTVQWLRERTTVTLLEPLALLTQGADAVFVWLASTELVCAGIEALGGFYGNGRLGKGTSFCRFVESFMHSDFSRQAHDHRGKSITYCEHLQKYFRSGLTLG